MVRRKLILNLLPLCFLASVVSGSAQLQPEPPDPLARIRDAAKTNVAACSATGETLCEQVAPKIIANAQGDSPLGMNVRRLAQEIQNAKISSSADAVAWAVAAFQAAGLKVRVEENSNPAAGSKSGPQVQQAVVAELRGREKPDEWVLLGARLYLDPRTLEPIRIACNAALVIEAARDIQLTGIHPRRSIRFVLFVDSVENMPPHDAEIAELASIRQRSVGSWAYVRAHRDELDHARAAIFFPDGADRISVYMLSGRQDIEAGLQEAMKPIESWRVLTDVSGASIYMGDFDFLLEGVPTILANQHQKGGPIRVVPAFSEALDKVDIRELKRNTAIAAVTAFGIAERADPIAPRQSRADIESLLNTTILGEQLRTAGLWSLWESGQRGRLP